MKRCYIGVDIGGTSIKIGRFSFDGELEEKWNIPTRKEKKGEFILSDIVVSVKERIEACGGRLEGIGFGVPGPVTKDGVVLKCANLGWDIVDCKKKVKSLMEVERVEVANDANVAGLGEAWKGAGRHYESIVMVTLGTGIGGSVVLDGKVLPGFKGAAGEIGHMKVEQEEEVVCGCGAYGCLEQYASASGIVRLAKKYKKKDSYLDQREHLSAKVVFDGVKQGDENCLEIVEKFGEYLGTALFNVSCVVDTEAIVIGGGVSEAGDILIDTVSKWYNKKSLYALKDKVFCLAELGNEAGIYGCVRMVIK